MRTPLSRLRKIGDVEGVTYLLLLGLAMPLKYLAGMPMAVTLVGSLHGGLFTAFMLALLQVHITRRWSWRKTCLAFLSSLVPFGTFALSRYIRQEELRENIPLQTHTSSTH
ncbi:MAG: DUF3817 domain-containing protein [Bacteroidetes bacterium]|nr:DUF3817 domain-containing protein [Bacteroidota bacterium]